VGAFITSKVRSQNAEVDSVGESAFTFAFLHSSFAFIKSKVRSQNAEVGSVVESAFTFAFCILPSLLLSQK
jgi:hypothetical protein